MHLGMPECHKPFLGHFDLDLWPSFQELLCPEHISYIIWCRNPKFGMVIPLGMAEWCIPFWVTLTLTLTSGLISRFSCYIIAIFPQMCLMLDQFLWGHSSRVCDISCLQWDPDQMASSDSNWSGFAAFKKKEYLSWLSGKELILTKVWL